MVKKYGAIVKYVTVSHYEMKAKMTYLPDIDIIIKCLALEIELWFFPLTFDL